MSFLTDKKKYQGPLYGAYAGSCLVLIASCTDYGRRRQFDIIVLSFICSTVRGKSNSGSCSISWIAKSLGVSRQQVSAAVQRLVANDFIRSQTVFQRRNKGQNANIYTLNSELIERYKSDHAQYGKDLRGQSVDNPMDEFVDNF